MAPETARTTNARRNLEKGPTSRGCSPDKGRALGGGVSFRGHITPETRLVRYEVSLRQVRRGRLAMGVANGQLFADDVCVYTAADLKVGMITSGA